MTPHWIPVHGYLNGKAVWSEHIVILEIATTDTRDEKYSRALRATLVNGLKVDLAVGDDKAMKSAYENYIDFHGGINPLPYKL